jgi:aldose 1-epimerase
MAAGHRGASAGPGTAVDHSPGAARGTGSPHGTIPLQRSVVAAELTGIASLAVRDLLNGPRREGAIIATIRGTVFAEFPKAPYEPRVIALSGRDAPRLPNAIIAVESLVMVPPLPSTTSAPSSPPSPPLAVTGPVSVTDLIVTAANPRPLRGRQRGPVVYAGGGMLRIGGLVVRARRWWDPSPVFGPLSRARLDRGATTLGRMITEPASRAPEQSGRMPEQATRPSMAGVPDVRALAACCASGDLAGAVEHAEILVGLGPGILPGGDGVLCGMLLALRLLGGALPGGTRAVWLADWLSAAVTGYARQRTTPLAASLLQCAAKGQAAAGRGATGACRARAPWWRPVWHPGRRRPRLGTGSGLSRGPGPLRILRRMTIPLTGEQYEIRAGEYAATVTALGAALRALAHGGRDLITTFDPDVLPPHSAGTLLSPWPNRVDHGTYTFDDAAYQLAVSEPRLDNAIHGLTRFELFSLVAQDASSITLRSHGHGAQGYPFAVQVDATYGVDATAGLTVAITATNVGSRPAPWGTAHHPYLTVATALVDDCDLTLPAAQWLPVNERLIPAGSPQDVAGGDLDFRAPRKIGAAQLDTAFTGLARDADGRAWVHLAGGGAHTGMWLDASYGWLQVFTSDGLEPGHRAALAVEPMTCPPNAFATGIDRIRLAPGQAVTHRWGLRSLD